MTTRLPMRVISTRLGVLHPELCPGYILRVSVVVTSDSTPAVMTTDLTKIANWDLCFWFWHQSALKFSYEVPLAPKI